jgi:hypothetical protein
MTSGTTLASLLREASALWHRCFTTLGVPNLPPLEVFHRVVSRAVKAHGTLPRSSTSAKRLEIDRRLRLDPEFAAPLANRLKERELAVRVTVRARQSAAGNAIDAAFTSNRKRYQLQMMRMQPTKGEAFEASLAQSLG